VPGTGLEPAPPFEDYILNVIYSQNEYKRIEKKYFIIII